MNRATRLLISAVAASAAFAGSLGAGLAAANPAADGSAKAVQEATRATLAAETLRFKTTVKVADVTVRASGAINLTDGRSAAQVRVGETSTEYRHVGRSFYVNARQLGSRDEPWVAMDSVSQSAQMSVRSIAGLASTVTPQRVLDALQSATSYTRVGVDVSGDQYRVVVAAPRISFVPLVDTFTAAPISGGAVARIDVWIGADALLSRLVVTTSLSTTSFELSHFGAPLSVSAPPESATGDLSSASGRFLFGSGVRFRNPVTPTPKVSLAPRHSRVDGVVQGNLNARSTTGQQLRFSLLSSTMGGKLSFGTVPAAQAAGGPQSFTALPYANWLDGGPKGLQSFRVQAREETRIGRYVTSLALIGDIASPVIDGLQDTAIVRAQLAPVIGATAKSSVDLDVNQLAPANTPIAMTYKVAGYRGTPISANFMPASGLSAGSTAPAVLKLPGLGEPGNTNPYEESTPVSGVLGTNFLRNADGPGDVAYNVITWDPRGEFDSGGIAQLNNPALDAIDASAIIDWIATSLPTELNGAMDPVLGMVGGSSGGELALVTAGIDPRVDAIVPVATWNSLISTLQPNGIANTSTIQHMLAALADPDVRLNSQIRKGLESGVAIGRFSSTTMSLLADKNVSTVLGQLQAPTLLFQSTDQAMFPVVESSTTAQRILSNPFGTPTKLVWFDASTDDSARDTTMATYAKAWFNKYLAGVPVPDSFTPTFQFWDQTRTRYTSNLYPFSPGFNLNTPLEGTSTGGTMVIAPTGTRVVERIRVGIPGIVAGQQVVGAPTVTFTYKGAGSARAMFARMIDTSARAALGAVATPLPLVLDGKRHTVSIALGDIVYSAGANPGLILQLSSADASFIQKTSGQVRITGITVDVPVVA